MDVGISTIRPSSEIHGVVWLRVEDVVDSAFIMYELESQLVVVRVDVLASWASPMRMAPSTKWVMPSFDEMTVRDIVSSSCHNHR